MGAFKGKDFETTNNGRLGTQTMSVSKDKAFETTNNGRLGTANNGSDGQTDKIIFIIYVKLKETNYKKI